MISPQQPCAHEALQQYLKLLAEAFKRTSAMAASLQEVVGDALAVDDLADACFNGQLANYPALEMQWLQLVYAAKVATVSSSTVELDTLQVVQ